MYDKNKNLRTGKKNSLKNLYCAAALQQTYFIRNIFGVFELVKNTKFRYLEIKWHLSLICINKIEVRQKFGVTH